MTEQTASDFRLSKNSVKRIMKEETGRRVAGDAALQVMIDEEERIKSLARAAEIIADEAGRETVLERDVMKAKKVSEVME